MYQSIDQAVWEPFAIICTPNVNVLFSQCSILHQAGRAWKKLAMKPGRLTAKKENLCYAELATEDRVKA